MARLVLVGLPGVGKSSVAQRLSEQWHCEWVDTDARVEAIVGMSPGDILRSRGEAAFREIEVAVLEEILVDDVVVSTGGGIVTTESARDQLRQQATIWLDCDDASIVDRVGSGDRPLLGADPASAIAKLRETRERWYADVARARVDAGGALEDVVARVAREAAAATR